MNKELEELKKVEKKLNTLLVKVMQRAYYNAREVGLPLTDTTNGDYSVHFWDGWLTSIKSNPEYQDFIDYITKTTPPHDEIKREAVRKLKEIKKKLDGESPYESLIYDEENAHVEADDVLLELIEDEEVKGLYLDIPKWYS